MDDETKLRLFAGSFVEIEPIEAEFEHPIRFVPPENLHLTWKFFGETEQEHIPQIIHKIEKVASQTGDVAINFNRFELWPDARYPRLLVLAGDDVNGNATKLFEALNRKKFRPHITIARFKIKKKPEKLIRLPENLFFEKRQINFKKISLLKSILTPKGSIYDEIRGFPLPSIFK